MKVVDDKKPLAAVVRVEGGRRELLARHLMAKTAEDAGVAAAAEGSKTTVGPTNKDGTEKSAKKQGKQLKKAEAGEKDFDVPKLKKKVKVATDAGDGEAEEKVRPPPPPTPPPL
jgi:hypothetical protein